MNRPKTTGFTIVELLIVIVVVGILVAISIVSYAGAQRSAGERATQSDLRQVAVEMQLGASKSSGTYPTALPSTIQKSTNVSLALKQSGTVAFYSSLTTVQNGVLFAQICQNLIDEGLGKGTNAGGGAEDYMTGCGNWNYNSTQIGGWSPKKFTTPVQEATLLSYADTFTTNDNYNKNQAVVLKNFYHQLVSRLKRQGGTFPITSFWDYWSTPASGGVPFEPIGTGAAQPAYCVEATHASYSDILWHITETQKLETGSC